MDTVLKDKMQKVPCTVYLISNSLQVRVFSCSVSVGVKFQLCGADNYIGTIIFTWLLTIWPSVPVKLLVLVAILDL